jgi:hypothetical protein
VFRREPLIAEDRLLLVGWDLHHMRRENEKVCHQPLRGPSFETRAMRAPRDEVVMRGAISNPHGEERGNAARLEP